MKGISKMTNSGEVKKKRRGVALMLIIGALLGSLVLLGCGENLSSSLAGPEEEDSFNPGITSLAKGKGNNNGGGNSNDGGSSDNDNSTNFPLHASSIFKYQSNQDGYSGGTVNIAGFSLFSLTNNSLVPPPDTPAGADVTITMAVDLVKYKGDHSLEFTFGPSGCQFLTPAELTLDWSILGDLGFTLYYIDDSGKYQPLSPDQIDLVNKKITIYIDHFSRYALSKG